MRHVRKTALALLVGLTAVSTLIAGMPHFVCRCPNGRVKPFCLASSSGISNCCCDGDCCASATKAIDDSACDSPAVAAETDGCCCGHGAIVDSAIVDSVAEGAVEEATEQLDPGISVQRGGCIRTLAVPEMAPLPDTKVNVGGADRVAWPLFDLGVAGFLIGLERASPNWQADRGPPPPDLVTVLRHLII